MAIKGVTFPNQKVSPMAHGAIFQDTLSDGLISGCNFSVAQNGLSITVSSGYMIVGGRLIRLTADYEITHLNDDSVTNCYKRIIAKINEQGISTESSFERFSFVVDDETSSTPDGFVGELTKNEINSAIASGVQGIYEIPIAVFQINASGIVPQDGLIYTMGHARPKRTTVEVVIEESDWEDDSSSAAYLTATKTVAGLSEFDQDPMVTYKPESLEEWSISGIYGLSHKGNKITFKCSSLPSNDVTALVIL